MYKIKADEDCRLCGGAGHALHFIAMVSDFEDGTSICNCIKMQIEIVPADNVEV